ncbi:MAG: PAS domain-containing protein, partial [bacterium]
MRFIRRSKIVGEQCSLQWADAMPQIIWTADVDGLADYYNQRWFDYTCLTMEETKGRGWAKVVHPEDLQETADGWNEAVRTGRDYETDARLKCGSNGQYRWHLIRAMRVKDEEGKTLKWYGTCTDIDDQKIAEDALLIARDELEDRVEARTVELVTANNGLVAEILERKQLEVKQQVLSEIIQGIGATSHLEELLSLIHRAIGKVLNAENFFVALYDPQTAMITMQFFVDQHDALPQPHKIGRSRTAYVFRTGHPALLTKDLFNQLVEQGEVESIGTP